MILITLANIVIINSISGREYKNNIKRFIMSVTHKHELLKVFGKIKILFIKSNRTMEKKKKRSSCGNIKR